MRRSGSGSDGVLATRDPRQPEGFGPLDPPVTLQPGDRLTTTCTYETTSREVGDGQKSWRRTDDILF